MRICVRTGDREAIQLATADIAELRQELTSLFGKYYERFNKLLNWHGWRYCQLLGESTVSFPLFFFFPFLLNWHGWRYCQLLGESTVSPPSLTPCSLTLNLNPKP